jgi:hypothetical protein
VYIAPFYSYGPGFNYPYFGYPFYSYPFYGNPYGYGTPYYRSPHIPYKLALEIQSIRTDYKNKIKETRKDRSLSHSERRHKIRSLKAQREQEIIDAQRNFRRRGTMNNEGSDNTIRPDDSSYNDGIRS